MSQSGQIEGVTDDAARLSEDLTTQESVSLSTYLQAPPAFAQRFLQNPNPFELQSLLTQGLSASSPHPSHGSDRAATPSSTANRRSPPKTTSLPMLRKAWDSAAGHGAHASRMTPASFSLTRQLLQGSTSSQPSVSTAGSTTDTGWTGARTRNRIKHRRFHRCPSHLEQPSSSQARASAAFRTEEGSGVPHVCSLCQKSYVHLRSLKDHLKAHRGLTECPVCSKTFSKIANMRAHFQAQHVTPDPSLPPPPEPRRGSD